MKTRKKKLRKVRPNYERVDITDSNSNAKEYLCRSVLSGEEYKIYGRK